MSEFVIDVVQSQVFWTALSTLALVATLALIARYTKSTSKMASATELMAIAQLETISLQKHPVVMFGCARQTSFYFSTVIKNFSTVHAKARVLVTIEINGVTLTLPPNHHYDGSRIWHIQAVGSEGPTSYGHLDLMGVLAHNKMAKPDESTMSGRITLRSWVINYYDPEPSLYQDRSENPMLVWDWRYDRWVPEIAPPDPT